MIIVITVSEKNTSYQYLKSNQKQWVEYVTCNRTKECPLYREGKCACYRYIFGKNLTCPNGKWHRLEGYTKRARKFGEFASKVERECAPTAKEYNQKLCLVAGYVFIPLPHLTGARNKFKGVEDGRVINEHFVKVEDFTEDFIEELMNFVPYTWFDVQPVRGFKDKDLPKFVQQLKEEMPVLYTKWVNKYPETASKYKDANPVGRTVYISSLPDGNVINGWMLNKGQLINNNYKNIFFGGTFGSKQPLKITVDVNDDMVTKVTENIIVNENTKYVD